MSTKTASGRFDVTPPSITITSQDDALFASAAYIGVGSYELNLEPLRELTSPNQIIPTGNAMTAGRIVTLTTTIRGSQGTGHHAKGLGVIHVHITDGAGNPVDDSFFVIAQIINL